MLRQARWSLLLLALFAGVLAARAQSLPNKSAVRKTISRVKNEISTMDSTARAPVLKDTALLKQKAIADTAALKAALQKTIEGSSTSFQNGVWQTNTPGVPDLKDGKINVPTANEVSNKLKAGNFTETGKRIYSHASLRELYDSLGISKLDTLLALANARQTVSQEELLRSVVSSFPGNKSADGVTTPAGLTDLSKLNLLTEPGMELPPMEGFNTGSSYRFLLDSLKTTLQTSAVRDKLKSHYQKKLDSLQVIHNQKLHTEHYKASWDSLSSVDPMLVKNMPLPAHYQHVFDSMRKAGNHKWESLDSVAGHVGLTNTLTQINNLEKMGDSYVAKWDSLSQVDLRQFKDPLMIKYTNLIDSLNHAEVGTWLHQKNKYERKLDSVRQIADKAKVTMKEQNVTQNFKTITLQKRPDFFQRINFEGILGILSNADSVQILQFSPAINFTIGKNLTIGGGPNMVWTKSKNDYRIYGSYRIMSKYYFLKQRMYAQLEDYVEPGRMKSYTLNTPHSVLAGMGYLVKISNSLYINAGLLYRVNNARYSDNKQSPVVFRIGISSLKPISNE